MTAIRNKEKRKMFLRNIVSTPLEEPLGTEGLTFIPELMVDPDFIFPGISRKKHIQPCSNPSN